jgi:hypothetical protein
MDLTTNGIIITDAINVVQINTFWQNKIAKEVGIARTVKKQTEDGPG